MNGYSEIPGHTGWQDTCAGDDYPSAGAGGDRPLLFVIARDGSDEAISQQDSNNSILPWEIITNTITGLAYSLEGVGKTESLKINIKVRQSILG